MAVTWGQPPLSFALQASDDRVRAHAAIVFRSWQSGASANPAAIWSVEPDHSGDPSAWAVSASGRADVFFVPSVAAAVRTVEFLAVQVLFDSPSACTLHAALVARGGRGVLLLGRAEAGKSTLGCALWQRGWTLLGDDTTLLDANARRAWTAPRRVLLRAATRALIGGDLWEQLLSTPAGELTREGCLFDPAELDGSERSDAVELGALVFLGRAEAGGVRRLEPAHALLELVPYTNVARRLAAGDVIRQLRPLVEAVPACDLGRGPLDEMVAAVEMLAEELV